MNLIMSDVEETIMLVPEGAPEGTINVSTPFLGVCVSLNHVLFI
jgi:hypothetical protein